MVPGDGGGDAVLPESMTDTLMGPASPKNKGEELGTQSLALDLAGGVLVYWRMPQQDKLNIRKVVNPDHLIAGISEKLIFKPSQKA